MPGPDAIPPVDVKIASAADIERAERMLSWIRAGINSGNEELGHEQGDTSLWVQALLALAGHMVAVAPLEVRGQIIESMQGFFFKHATRQMEIPVPPSAQGH